MAALEFALTLPLWITMLLGVADGTYCLLINEKTDRIAYSVTDIATQYKSLSLAQLNDIILAASELMKPFPFDNKGLVIVSSIYKPAGESAYICWQYSGGGTLVQSSKIGTTGGVPTLPAGLTLNDYDNVLVSEVYYDFSPIFTGSGLFSSGVVYRTAIYKPRLSPLCNTPI
ncbi:MAG: hypothetical protein ABTQ34_02270 [Bdellovibrionales bacterium]